MDQVSDKVLMQKVTRQLSNRGMRAPCQIVVAARQGDITLSGTIQYEHQRRTAVQAARGVEGVRRVMEHLLIQAKNRQWK